MSNAQSPKESGARKRKAILSPELNEFLHMLKALENEMAAEPAQAQ